VTRYLRLCGLFLQTSFQEEAAYRANYYLSLMYSILNLVTGVLGIYVLFGQVQVVNGWDFESTLSLLGVYLTLGALRNFVFGPSLESLVGMDGEVWSGRLDFTLIRPVATQFLASFRKWRLFALFDLALGVSVLIYSGTRLGQVMTIGNLIAFFFALVAGVVILYAILLIFSALVFWSPGILFTWVFDGLFQMARYPLGLYPAWLRFVLTWIIPVGVITTLPVEALGGTTTPAALMVMAGLAVGLLTVSSALFYYGLRHYKSASS
jgi:ABC-2 type transport system permease protein